MGGTARRWIPGAVRWTALSLVLAAPVASVEAQTCTPCATPTTCTATEGVKLRLRKMDDGLGNERLLFRSDLIVPDDTPIDLVATGLRLVMVDGTGATTFDIQIPPGQFNKATGGWAVNGTGTAWSYRSHDSTSADGISRALVRRHGFGSGDLKLILFGQDMTFTVPARPITVTTSLSSGDSTATYCGDVTFTDDDCRFRNQQNKLLCYDRTRP